MMTLGEFANNTANMIFSEDSETSIRLISWSTEELNAAGLRDEAMRRSSFRRIVPQSTVYSVVEKLSPCQFW
jgi:hypothetical protein